jgi:hypothetical protein
MISTAGLANRAKQAWKANEEERKERHVNETVKFVEEAKKAFVWVFGDEKITSIKAINPDNVEIVCEDVTFIVQKRGGGIVFLVKVKCQYCGKQFLPKYANNVIDLVGVGGRLSAPQTCEACLKEKRDVVEVSSTAELVLEKVVEIYDLIKEE